MPRPRRDGTPASAPSRRKLTDLFVKKVEAGERAFAVWDTHQRGPCVLVQPTGHKSWKAVYTRSGQPRWYHIGAVAAVGLGDARRIAGRIMVQVAEGRDPVAERDAERGRGTFSKVAARYVDEHAKRTNKSWRQADALVQKHLIPRWGKLQARAVTRADARKMMSSITAPIVANQTLAAASAIFAWAMKQDLVAANPCARVDRNPTRSRERVLSDSEVPKFWAAFDSAGPVRSAALKMILLTGQRPGEVRHMRREHIIDGWWEMPGDPAPGWPGTKNGVAHRVWLPAAARDLMSGIASTGFVFAGPRDNAVDKLEESMSAICKSLGADRATPHDLRHTHGTMITGLGFGRDAMNRIQNHREGGIASVYDRHGYAEENKRVMEATAASIMALSAGGAHDQVVPFPAKSRLGRRLKRCRLFGVDLQAAPCSRGGFWRHLQSLGLSAFVPLWHATRNSSRPLDTPPRDFAGIQEVDGE
jgi:integrase